MAESKARLISAAFTSTGDIKSDNLDNVSAGFDSADVLTISAPLSNRNLIINGAMTVSQRGTSISATADSTYTADRFRTRNYGGNGTYTVSTLQTDVPSEGGFKYSTKFAVNSAATDTGTYAYGVEQSIEGYNIAQLRLGRSDAKQFTLSFWVKSSLSGTYTSAVRTSTAEYSYVFEFSLTANTWTKITKTIPALTSTLSSLDETDGAGLLVSPINLGAQTSKSTATTNTWLSGNYVFTSNQVDWMGTAGATCHLTGVQLEVGETATPFEHRSYADELARCQRYLYRTSGGPGATNAPNHLGPGFAYSGTNLGHVSVHFPQTMRAKPTFSFSGISAWNGSSYAITSIVTNNSSLQVGTLNLGVASGLTTTRGYAILSPSTGAGYIQFDAEL
jgi:hypothetical protein